MAHTGAVILHVFVEFLARLIILCIMIGSCVCFIIEIHEINGV